MDGFPEGIESRFRYVLLVAKRAEQLIQGAQPKVKPRHAKPARIAMDEVAANLVKWQLSAPVEEEPTAISE